MLRFDLDGADGPGLRRGADGRLETLAGIAALRQSVLVLLATRPGERLERPEFGCALDLLAFEPNDDTTAGLALRLVAEAVARFEPRARIETLDAGPDPQDPARLVIALTIRDRSGGERAALSYPLSLAP